MYNTGIPCRTNVNMMTQKRIILKTHGLRNSSEVGIVILPESFYVKVSIELSGDFYVEFIDSNEEQLFSVCHSVGFKVEKEPTELELKGAQNYVAQLIVDSLAEHLLDGSQPTYDTEAHLDQWAAPITHIFRNNYEVKDTDNSGQQSE